MHPHCGKHMLGRPFSWFAPGSAVHLKWKMRNEKNSLRVPNICADHMISTYTENMFAGCSLHMANLWRTYFFTRGFQNTVKSLWVMVCPYLCNIINIFFTYFFFYKNTLGKRWWSSKYPVMQNYEEEKCANRYM